jgi:hypothetical protein
MLFVLGIGVNLAHGRKPDCHCFGQLHPEPVSRSTLIRNGLLAVLAGFIVWQGQYNTGPSAVSWVGRLAMTELLLVMDVFAVLAVECWFRSYASTGGCWCDSTPSRRGRPEGASVLMVAWRRQPRPLLRHRHPACPSARRPRPSRSQVYMARRLPSSSLQVRGSVLASFSWDLPQ